MNKYCDRVLMKLIVVLLLVMAHEAIATDTGSRVPREPIGKCDDMLCDGLGMPSPNRIAIFLDPEADMLCDGLGMPSPNRIAIFLDPEADMLCDGLGMPSPNRIAIFLDPEADQWGVEAGACGPNLNLEPCNPAARVGASDVCPSGNPLLETPLEIKAPRDPRGFDLQRGAAITCIIFGKKRICFRI